VTTTKAAATSGCYPLTKSSHKCYEPGQICAKEYRGTTGIDAYGYAIRCVDKGKNWQWVRI
jgi:hypothetical protein